MNNEVNIARELAEKLFSYIEVTLKQSVEAQEKAVQVDRNSRVIAKELASREESLRLERQRFDEEKEWLKRERMQLVAKELELKQDKQKYADIDIKMHALEKKEQEIASQQNKLDQTKQELEQLKERSKELEEKEREIQKQIAIDRKRKELIQVKEAKIDTELQRLQRISQV